ncbi:atpase involved in chromosome partitioning [Haemophilus influenzae]|uniref:Atpase involved in chromosome partitioning n=1 Tax=Haemophilus influenzae TaxID=727 RepID=A0A2X1PVF6_HAEIF|nr:atpase involved in chromosome partitioning [Haemophilus influenzae]
MDFSSISKKPYIITVACTKGGSAKSTNAANIWGRSALTTV